MAYTSCASKIAGNIAKDCAHPLVDGYTGRGVLIPVDSNPTIVVSAENPRTLTSITLAQAGKLAVIDNVWRDAFSGSGTQSSADSGRTKYTKTFVFRVPLRGSDVSKDIVEPLADAPLGYIAVLEKKDKVGNGSFEVVGYLQGLTANADGIVRNEGENGGDISVTMSCMEDYFEVTMFDTDYQTTKTAFDALLQKGF